MTIFTPEELSMNQKSKRFQSSSSMRSSRRDKLFRSGGPSVDGIRALENGTVVVIGRAQSARETFRDGRFDLGNVADSKTILGRAASVGKLESNKKKPVIVEAQRGIRLMNGTSDEISRVVDTSCSSVNGRERLSKTAVDNSPSNSPRNEDPLTNEEEIFSFREDEKQSPVEQVALIVPTTDDPSLPVWTFRTWFLGVISCTIVSFLGTYFSYRTEPIVITITTVLIATAPIGHFMATALPNKYVRLPGTNWGFSLNPGPFNMKEHTLITIIASVGSARAGGIFVINVVKVFFKSKLTFLPAFLVTLTVELLGFSWAALLCKFMVEPASMWWPGTLVNVSLVMLVHEDHKESARSRGKGRMSLMQFLLICFMASFAYYVIPGFFITSFTTVSVVCYIFKDSVLAQQLGSGTRGLGLGAVSFDWGTIISFLGSPLVVPWAAVLNIVVGFVLQAFVMGPITYWNDWYKAKNFPIYSNVIFTKFGMAYNVSRILTRDEQLDEFGLKAEGLPYFSAYFTMSMGVTFSLFAAICSQIVLFHGKDLVRVLKSAILLTPGEPEDIHTRLMNNYPKVPVQWSLMVFFGTYLTTIVFVVVYKDQLQMKWWGVLLSAAAVLFMVFPITILLATTNQIPQMGIMSQYMMGYISPGEPVSNCMFRTYSTLLCSRAGTYMGNFKFGHYMKVPARATFFAQLLSVVISALVCTLASWWLISSIDNICDVSKLPPNTPWTCPADAMFYDEVILFGLVGPRRLLTNLDAPYRTLNYYFLPGLMFPAIVWVMGVSFPKFRWIRLINAPLIVRGAWHMPPALASGNTTWIYVALFFSVYVYRYKKGWWKRYNFVLSAALEAGTVLMAIVLYYSLDDGKKRLMWWGRKEKGDHCPLAACPTARGVEVHGCPVH